MATAARTASAPTRRAFLPGTVTAPAVGAAIDFGRSLSPADILSMRQHHGTAPLPDPLSPA